MAETLESASSMVRVNCPVCHGRDEERFLQVPDRFSPELTPRYTLVRCRRCGLVYLNPRPHEEMSAIFYQHEAYTPFTSTHQQHSVFDRLYRALRLFNNRWKRQKIERLRPEKGSLLDVGCGTGEFLLEMAKSGWQVRGVEKDARAAAYAVESLELRVVAGGIERLPAMPASFEVVTLWHVLEHLYDPHRTLMQIRDLLKVGGLLVLAVPNVESIDAKVYRDSWVAFDAPRHLQHFTLQTLRTLCEMHKFTFVKSLALPFDPYFNALSSENLDEKIHHRGKFGKLFRLLRAGLVADRAFLAGLLRHSATNSGASSIMTFWRK